MKRSTIPVVTTTTVYLVGSDGSQVVGSDASLIIGHDVVSESVYPIALTAPVSSFRLLVPARRAYSKSTSVTFTEINNLIGSDSSQIVGSDGADIVGNRAFAQDSNPIVLTAPPQDTGLVAKE